MAHSRYEKPRKNMYKIKIITSTTRPGRKGIAVARWLENITAKESEFEVELLDLAEIGLPIMDEPVHPRLQQYQHAHTKEWSARIDSADAFIFVLGEYNYGVPSPLKNALDYLYKEWMYKPVGIVSYGGASGGMRSTQMLRQILSAFHSLPLSAGVAIVQFSKFLEEERFVPEAAVEKATETMLGELKDYCVISQDLRKKRGA